MARGRMISATLGRSEKFNQLSSDFQRLVYILTLTHADAEGRVEAKPRLIWADHFPFSEATPDDVQAALAAIHRTGLGELYMDGDKTVLQFAKFHEFNTITRYPDGHEKAGAPSKEAPSKLSPPTGILPDWPELAEATPEQLRSNSGPTPEQLPANRIEVQSQSESKRSEEHSSTSSSLAERPTTQVAQARRTHIDYQEFIDTWNQQAQGLPAVQKLNEARRRGIQRLCKEHGIAEALGLLHDAATQVATDEFWIERQFGFDNLVPKKVVEKAEKLRATKGMKPSEVKLAREAQGWLSATGGNHGN